MSYEWLETLIKYPRALLRILFVIINNVYCIPTYLVWMLLLLPLKKIHPETFYKIEGKLFHWLLANVAMWNATAGYDIVELGDDITPCMDQRTLVLVNHQSTGDVPLLMTTFNTKDCVLPNIMWIMDKFFKYTNFGIVSVIHQDFFIGSGPRHRDEALVQLKQHLETSYIPRRRKWMVLFPEGGFLHKRREASQRFAQKNNLPLLQHVTLPRIGAMKTIVEVLGPCSSTVTSVTTPDLDAKKGTFQRKESDDQFYIDNEYSRNSAQNTPLATPPATPTRQALYINNQLSSVDSKRMLTVDGDDENLKELSAVSEKSNYLKYILDITIAYADKEPLDLPNIITGLRKPHKTNLLYRLYRISEVPKEEAALTQWLYDKFIEKEELLKNFYATGSFAQTPYEVPPTIVQQDVLRFLIIHLFFMTSSYIHFQMFSMLFQCYQMYVIGS